MGMSVRAVVWFDYFPANSFLDSIVHTCSGIDGLGLTLRTAFEEGGGDVDPGWIRCWGMLRGS